MAKKRANGEGNIYRRKNGSWGGRYTVHTPDGPKRKAVYGKTQREVRKKLAEAIADRDKGLIFDTKNLTLEQYLQYWLNATIKNSVKDSTFDSYSQMLRCHAIPSLGHVKLKTLAQMHLRHLYQAKLDQGLSTRTVRYLHTLVKMALKHAVIENYVPRNVAEAVKPPKLQAEEINPLSPPQARHFLESVRGDRLETMYVLAIKTGLRQGELLGLKWEDINFEEKFLSVRRTLSGRTKTPTFTKPKTVKSRRTVRLSDETLRQLKEHKSRQEYESHVVGEQWRDFDLVFCSVVGTPLDRHNLATRSLRPLLKEANLPQIRFHDLRHTCATLLLIKGTNPKYVQELLGHSSISITLNTYSHVLPNMQSEIVTVMDEIFEEED